MGEILRKMREAADHEFGVSCAIVNLSRSLSHHELARAHAHPFSTFRGDDDVWLWIQRSNKVRFDEYLGSGGA